MITLWHCVSVCSHEYSNIANIHQQALIAQWVKSLFRNSHMKSMIITSSVLWQVLKKFNYQWICSVVIYIFCCCLFLSISLYSLLLHQSLLWSTLALLIPVWHSVSDILLRWLSHHYTELLEGLTAPPSLKIPKRLPLNSSYVFANDTDI